MSDSDSIAHDATGISVSGPESADVLVMLHMSGVNRHMWEGVVSLLDDSFRCVTVDLPGFGDLADQEFTVDSATDRIRTVSDSLGANTMDLIGLSLGGYIAQAYVAENPERVSALLISGATAPLTGLRGAAFRLFGSVISVLMPLFGKRATRRFTKSLRQDLDPGLAEAIISGGLSPRGGGQVFRRLPGTDYARAMVGYLGSIVIANGEDDTMNRKSEDRFLSLFPDAELIAIPEAGHAVPLDQPELFARAVRRVMNSTSPE